MLSSSASVLRRRLGQVAQAGGRLRAVPALTTACAQSRAAVSRAAAPRPVAVVGTIMPFSSEASEEDLGEREAMEYDVVIVGAGPAGLSAAIRLRQLCAESDQELSVCVLEKGAEVGNHIVSGNCFEPRALNELLPEWKDMGAPVSTPATDDVMMYLTEDKAFTLPTIPLLHNEGNYIISLSQLCAWLGEQAEELGVDIFPGTPASEVLYGDKGEVIGVATSDVGIAKDGSVKDDFARGYALLAKQTIFAEGARGSCSEALMANPQFGLRDDSDPQTYGLGIKEVWEVPEGNFRRGFNQHTIGWPLKHDVYGGTFLYHMDPNIIVLGMVIGLNYKNPYLNPYREFQRWKHHPEVAEQLEGGQCIQYGARCLNEGGFQALPKLSFPGGMLTGCAAGFLNVPKIKGTHTAMKTGMLAGEAAFEALTTDPDGASGANLTSFQKNVEGSWVWDELKSVRNYHPSFKWGLLPGVLYSGISAFVLRGREPWTFRHSKRDSEYTEPASQHTPIDYPKPDGTLSFDLLTNLARAGTAHEHDQPSHLRIKSGMDGVPASVSFATYAAPESRFCPAGVYEYPEGDKLVINAQNCVHCKCCSIKMPEEYIQWTVPEAGGGGPS